MCSTSGNYVLPESTRSGQVSKQLNEKADATQQHSNASEILIGFAQFQAQDFDADISDISGLVSASQVSSPASVSSLAPASTSSTVPTAAASSQQGAAASCQEPAAKVECKKKEDKWRCDRERNGTAVKNTTGLPFRRWVLSYGTEYHTIPEKTARRDTPRFSKWVVSTNKEICRVMKGVLHFS